MLPVAPKLRRRRTDFPTITINFMQNRYFFQCPCITLGPLGLNFSQSSCLPPSFPFGTDQILEFPNENTLFASDFSFVFRFNSYTQNSGNEAAWANSSLATRQSYALPLPPLLSTGSHASAGDR
jgi:hypothetical protein